MTVQENSSGGFSWQEVLGGLAALATAVTGVVVGVRKSSNDTQRKKTDVVEANITALSRIIDNLKDEIERLKESRDEESTRAERFESRAHNMQEQNEKLRTQITVLERAKRVLEERVQTLERAIAMANRNIRTVADQTGVRIEQDLPPPYEKE